MVFLSLYYEEETTGTQVSGIVDSGHISNFLILVYFYVFLSINNYHIYKLHKTLEFTQKEERYILHDFSKVITKETITIHNKLHKTLEFTQKEERYILHDFFIIIFFIRFDRLLIQML